MTDFKIEDIELKNTDSKHLELSIMLAPDGLSCCILNRKENKFIALSHVSGCNTAILQQEWIENSYEASRDYAITRIIVCTARSLIIPAAVFRADKIENVFGLHFGEHSGFQVKSYHLRKTDNYVVFDISEKLYKAIQKKQAAAIYLSQAASLIDHNITQLRLNQEKTENTVFINMYNNYFDLMCTSGDKLLLYNTFCYKTANDIVYFILSIFEQYKLNQDKTHVILSGFIEKDNLAVIKLKKFVSMVFFESRNPAFNYYYKFQDIQSHYFYNLLNSFECE